MTAETGNRETWWDWNHKDNRFAANESDEYSAASTLSGKFLINRLQCSPVAATSSSGDRWTTELKSIARVDSDTQSLSLLGVDTEQAIDLWIVEMFPTTLPLTPILVSTS